LRTLLRGGVALARADEALTISRSLPHGHVAAVLGTAERIGLPDPGSLCRPRMWWTRSSGRENIFQPRPR